VTFYDGCSAHVPKDRCFAFPSDWFGRVVLVLMIIAKVVF
jgi:hypothetical protein